MIFVPEKEKCSLWNNGLDEFIYIVYDYNHDIKISFKWMQKEKNDPFYIQLDELTVYKENGFDGHTIKILNCVEIGCQASPQLRYNNIIKKWFVTCPSSMICTKNDDNDELEIFVNTKFTEENGFFDNPVNAILDWNKNIALFYIDESNFLKI